MKKTVCLIFCAVLISGCASYNRKFKSKSVADIGMFADSTIAMLGDLNLNLNREETLLVRRFVDFSLPEEKRVEEMADELVEMLEAIVSYSIEIVNMSELDVAETSRVQLYADYLVRYRADMLRTGEIDAESFDSTIEEVAGQETFVEALRKAQPLLNASVLEGALNIGELVTALESLALKVDSRIDAEYADIIDFRAKLEDEKFDILTAVAIIYDAYRLEDPNLDALRDSGVIWTPEIIPEGRPTRDDLRMIGDHLASRMQALETAQNAIEPNWQDYLDTHRELDKIIDETILSVQQARIMMLTWVRAHQKMASGRVDPAEWFDVGEVTKSLIRSAPNMLL